MRTDVAGSALTQLADVPTIEQYLESALAEHPTSPWAKTALAARFVAIAWEARSRAQAEDVSREQFEIFFDWLNRADDLLDDVNAEHPDFAPAWSVGLVSARGLQFGPEEVWRRYRNLAAGSPHDYPAQAQRLQSLLPKWSGTWAQAEDFVREEVAAAPGSNSAALVALFHIENWSEKGDTEGIEHASSPEVLADLRQAADSLLSNNEPLDPVSVQAHNAFTMAFWLSDSLADAAVHVRLANGRFTEFPWRYISPTPAFMVDIRRYILGEKKRWFER